jgi:hypothetical protein
MGVGPDPDVIAAVESRGNVVVFFDVALGDGPNSADLGRIKMELFVKDVSINAIFHSVFVYCVPVMIIYRTQERNEG